ncbi:Histone-arginine methyltransferase CARM1, partial [Varanus komodoensis]
MAATSPPPRLLQYSVKLLLLSEEQLLEGLHLSNPGQKVLRLEVQPREEDADMTVTDGENTTETEATPSNSALEKAEYGELEFCEHSAARDMLLEKLLAEVITTLPTPPDMDPTYSSERRRSIAPFSKGKRVKNRKHAKVQDKADGVCVFKCLVNKDTEYCRVGKESVLITLGYNSALLQFRSHSEYSTFSNALKNCRNQHKEHSVFSQRTEESSAAQYFQFYGCLSQQQNMMQDFVRTATYHRAILQNHIDFKDKVVLDVGCGSGILSFFAVQAGARKVYAVEASSVAKYAE